MGGLRFARWRIAAAALAVLPSLFAVTAVQAQAQGPTTVVSVIHLEGQPLSNSCNGDETVLHGDLTNVATHVPTADGGEIVQGTSFTTNLVGSGLPSGLTYRAANVEVSFVLYEPPPGTGFTARDIMLWLLVPDGDAPTMYLAMVIGETVDSNGGQTLWLDKTYLLCGPPPRL